MARFLTVIFSAIILCSCHAITGSGNVITQTRHLDQFEGVKASGSIDIEVINDASQLVRVEADDNVMQYIITSVEDGILNVHFRSNISLINTHTKVYVSAPSLTKLFVTGSGSITSKDTLANTGQIEFKVSGSGDVNAIVDAPSIKANIGGSGSINLQGRTKDFDCTVTGSGDLKCNKLLSENTTATITGSATAHVFASVHLVATVTGSGDIYYSGHPASPEIHKTGSGSVQEEK